MLPILYAGAFLGAYNANCVSIALPSIIATFTVDAAAAQWLVSGYMMVQAVMIAVYAFLSRRFTTRHLFIAATVIYIFGGIGAMVSPNFPLLLVFRVVQACGGALFIPIMMGGVLVLAPREKLASYLALGNVAIAVGPAFAPIISGMMITFLGWRSVFIVPIILMTLVSVVGLRFVKPLMPTQRVRFDIPSIAFVTLTLFAFVLGIGQLIMNLPLGLGILVGAVISGFLFVRRQNALETPLLNMQPLRTVSFTLCCLLILFAIMQNFSMSLLLPMYFQDVHALTAFESGLLLLIPLAIMTVIMLMAGRLMDRWGAWPLLPIGFLVLVIGQVLVGVFSSQLAVAAVVAASILVYSGSGIVQSPIQTTALKPLKPEENPSGVSLINICIQSASAIGPALFVGIFSNTAAKSVMSGTEGAAAQADGFVAAIIAAALLAVIGLAIAIPTAKKSSG
jgi:DHA2 family lincomycin resistance protein-like MFS transporter